MKETNTPLTNTSKKKVLFLFTTSYPFGNFEQNLAIEAELLSKEFDSVYVFPVGYKDTIRSMPSNFKTIAIHKSTKFRKSDLIFKFFSFSGIFFTEIFRTPFSGGYYFSHMRSSLKRLFNAFSTAKALDELIVTEGLEKNKIHFYSYWFYHWPLVFAFYKKFGKQKVNVISRAHMADLYQAPYDFPPNPFSYFKLKHIDTFFPTSDHGGDYIKKNFPSFSSKIQVSRSGIATQAMGPFPNTDEFVIVTCSTAQKRKRIYLMPQILDQLGFKVKWVHFGDGPELVEIENACKSLSPNVKVEFKGFVQNDGLFKYYENDPVNVFLNLSTAEGLPFSIVEAIAFGIPVIATDVFGTPEICNAETGILLPKELDAKLVADTLKKFKDSEMNKIEFRKSVKAFWDKKYNSDKNYPEFIKKAFGN